MYSRSLKADFDSLSTSDGLVLLDSRLIVLPLPTVKPVLRLLHASHSGVNKTLNYARGWPEMVNDVKQMISHCSLCSRVLLSPSFTPMVMSPPSTHLGFPMQHVGLDLFPFGGKQYLICVDHWSGYPLYSVLLMPSLPFYPPGSTSSTGLPPFVATVSLSSVGPSLPSVQLTILPMSCQHPIIGRVTA